MRECRHHSLGRLEPVLESVEIGVGCVGVDEYRSKCGGGLRGESRICNQPEWVGNGTRSWNGNGRNWCVAALYDDAPHKGGSLSGLQVWVERAGKWSCAAVLLTTSWPSSRSSASHVHLKCEHDCSHRGIAPAVLHIVHRATPKRNSLLLWSSVLSWEWLPSLCCSSATKGACMALDYARSGRRSTRYRAR